MVVDPRVCPSCGGRDDAPMVDGAGADGAATLQCRACRSSRSFARLPLFCLTGPSGAGKSAVAALLAPRLATRVVTLEQDVLWDPALAHAPDGTARFRATWLRLAAMIGQSGRPVLLCGTVDPAELAPLPERVLFARIHYLALVPDPAVLVQRLRRRPAWRGWDEARIAETVDYARWWRRTGGREDGAPDLAPTGGTDPGVTVIDTTDRPVEEVASLAETWVGERLPYR